MLRRDSYILRIVHDGAAGDPRWAARLEPVGLGQAMLFRTPGELVRYLHADAWRADDQEPAPPCRRRGARAALRVVPWLLLERGRHA